MFRYSLVSKLLDQTEENGTVTCCFTWKTL